MRTIFHLSYPKVSGQSVNDHIPQENYSLQIYNTDIRLDDARACPGMFHGQNGYKILFYI